MLGDLAFKAQTYQDLACEWVIAFRRRCIATWPDCITSDQFGCAFAAGLEVQNALSKICRLSETVRHLFIHAPSAGKVCMISWMAELDRWKAQSKVVASH